MSMGHISSQLLVYFPAVYYNFPTFHTLHLQCEAAIVWVTKY